MNTKTEDNRKARKYSGSEQFRRVAWGMLKPLFRFSPRVMFGWRNSLLRVLGASIGKQVHIYNTATIYFPWNLKIGDWSAIGEHAYIYNLGQVTIGKNVTISQRAHLCAGTHDYTDSALTLLKPPIVIHDQAWVCADAFVGPGVTVGEGAVVGARAVLVGDADAWQVLAGNPARVVKTRQLKGQPA